MSPQDRHEFAQYLAQCTDRQVLGCYEKESAAGRREYVRLCRTEMIRRGLY